MSYKVDDFVRIVRCDPGAMIAPYVGSEGVIIDAPDDKPGLYMVELDIGRSMPNRPRFVVREDMIEPDVTEAMIVAGSIAVGTFIDDMTKGGSDNSNDYFRDLYRAMRAARSK